MSCNESFIIEQNERDTKISYSLWELSIYVDIAIPVGMYHPLLFNDVTVCSYKQLLSNDNCNTNSDRIPSAYGQVNLPFFAMGEKKNCFLLVIHTNTSECTSIKLLHAVSLCFKHFHGSTRHAMPIYDDVKFMIRHLFRWQVLWATITLKRWNFVLLLSLHFLPQYTSLIIK